MAGVEINAWVACSDAGVYSLWVHSAPVYDRATGDWRQHLLRPFNPNRLAILSPEEVESLCVAVAPGGCCAVRLSVVPCVR